MELNGSANCWRGETGVKHLAIDAKEGRRGEGE